ncbi:MAG TPA: CCA tRNA nucleotidyltransferase [Candidatus Dormibacteraeota bacterium]|nr:CCA tRNA nucleotidyltransferase [Candidatus Dormibacteraeota bacterium]
MSAGERAARAVIAGLHAAGHIAYFVGGSVRDQLLGAQPSEFDVATDATAAEVQALFKRTVPVGAQFGVVIVLIDGHPVEVASFRADEEYRDGRRPIGVRPATPEEDAQRRDFTINGMFRDADTGEVLDFVGGQADLQAGVIRAIGDPAARFSEDRLRMLRAVRIAARLDFAIEPATFAAIRAHAAAITSVSWERIGDEIIRILTEGAARRGFALLDESGLLAHVLPEIAAMKGVEQSPDYHPEGDVFTHTLLLLDGLSPESTEELALAALLHDVSKRECAERRPDGRITFYGHAEIGAEKAVAICQRLRRSRETWERVEWLVRHHLRIATAPQMRRSTLRRFLAEPHFEALLELVRLDILASNKNLEAYEFCRQAQATFAGEPIKPPPLLRGRDLLALGYPTGPLFAEILGAVEERQLEGELTTRDDALAWVQRTYARPG